MAHPEPCGQVMKPRFSGLWARRLAVTPIKFSVWFPAFCRKVGMLPWHSKLFVTLIVLGSFWPLAATCSGEQQEYIFRAEVREVGSPIVVQAANSFLVNVDGYLVTSFSAISAAVFNPGRYEVLIFVNDSPLIGQVEFADLISGLALIRIPKTFPSAYNLAESSSEESVGLVLTGYPENQNMLSQTISSLGKKEVSYLERNWFSGEWREGLTGAPIFNSKGEIVSVGLENLTGSRQILGSTIESLKQIKQKIGTARKLANSRSWAVEIAGQVKVAESKFAERAASIDQQNFKKVGGVSFTPIGSNPHCHAEEVFDKGKSGKLFQCRGRERLSDDESLSPMNTNFFALSKSDLATSVEDFPKVEAFLKDKQGRSISALKSSFCSIRNLQNSKRVKMIVRICSREDSSYAGLSSTFVKINLLEDAYSDFLFQAYFSGMSFDFTMDRLTDFLESIKVEKR